MTHWGPHNTEVARIHSWPIEGPALCTAAALRMAGSPSCPSVLLLPQEQHFPSHLGNQQKAPTQLQRHLKGPCIPQQLYKILLYNTSLYGDVAQSKA